MVKKNLIKLCIKIVINMFLSLHFVETVLRKRKKKKSNFLVGNYCSYSDIYIYDEYWFTNLRMKFLIIISILLAVMVNL